MNCALKRNIQAIHDVMNLSKWFKWYLPGCCWDPGRRRRVAPWFLRRTRWNTWSTPPPPTCTSEESKNKNIWEWFDIERTHFQWALPFVIPYLTSNNGLRNLGNIKESHRELRKLLAADSIKRCSKIRRKYYERRRISERVWEPHGQLDSIKLK